MIGLDYELYPVCETCGGKGKVRVGMDAFMNVAFLGPCPDCYVGTGVPTRKKWSAIIAPGIEGEFYAAQEEWRVRLDQAGEYRIAPPEMW